MEKEEHELLGMVTSLRDLLDREAANEDAFQTWFEKNPRVFDVLGYRRVLTKPRLTKATGEFFEPDFMVEDCHGVWWIFELKRADTVVLKNPARRTDFRSE